MKTVKVHGTNVVEFNVQDTRYTLYRYIDKRISDAITSLSASGSMQIDEES